jgi:cytochrome c oxidase subunit 2
MPSALDPHGPAAAILAHDGVLVLALFVGVTAVLWLLVLWVALRKRGSLSEHAPIDVGGGMGWVLVGGLGVPAAVLAGVFIGMLTELHAIPMEAGHVHGTPAVKVIGHRWWWEVEYRAGGTSQYVTTANEVHVPTGTDVDIELATTDVIHSFWVPSLHGKVDLIPNQSTHIRIQATDVHQARVRHVPHHSRHARACHGRTRPHAHRVTAFARWRLSQRRVVAPRVGVARAVAEARSAHAEPAGVRGG